MGGMSIDDISGWVQENFTPAQRRQIAPFWALNALLAGFLFLFLAYGLSSFRSWQTTGATVLTAGRERSLSGARRRGHDFITYSYTVSGREYKNDRYSYCPNALISNLRRSHRIIERSTYKQGNSVTVHYNPRKPEQSTLVVETVDAWFELIGYLIYFVSALILFVRESKLPD